MADNTCFALRDHKRYYVAQNECYALSWEAFKQMKSEDNCGNVGCPFFKPQRSDVRAEKKIFTKNGDERIGLSK